VLIAGWRELVELPAWGIDGLRAKLDTGARTSALHVVSVIPDGHGAVTFDVVPRRRSDRRIPISAPIVRETRVRSSTGELTTRHVVRTRLRIGPFEREIELTLVDRAAMIHRMLVGREALVGVAVDPSRRYLLTAPPARKGPEG
jgi:hypothetical protein